VGGFVCKFIGGAANGRMAWLPQLDGVFRVPIIPPIDEILGSLKREGISKLDIDPLDFDEYTLMPFTNADGHFIYMAIDGNLED